jgi:hypothetical protein
MQYSDFEQLAVAWWWLCEAETCFYKQRENVINDIFLRILDMIVNDI